ncbi:MAG: nucleotidyltransferase domain-containing protein [Afipia felis]|nr:nucleotidyltransferase domain-containing protein [Afipia felis]
MIAQTSRPTVPVPREIEGLVSLVRDTFHSSEIWLFGSRANGTARPDSDWDLLVVLDDNATDDLMNPELAWRISRAGNVPSTILTTTRQDLEEVWGLPNTLGYDLAREGVRLLAA